MRLFAERTTFNTSSDLKRSKGAELVLYRSGHWLLSLYVGEAGKAATPASGLHAVRGCGPCLEAMPAILALSSSTACDHAVADILGTQMSKPVRSGLAAAGLQHLREMRLVDVRVCLTVVVSGRGLPKN